MDHKEESHKKISQIATIFSIITKGSVQYWERVIHFLIVYAVMAGVLLWVILFYLLWK